MNVAGQSGVPILARVWQEDDVWNVSAFDLPVVAYGEDVEAARANFEEAVQSHFEALAALHRLDTVMKTLKQTAAKHGFYEERVKPHVLVENFVFHPLQELAA